MNTPAAIPALSPGSSAPAPSMTLARAVFLMVVSVSAFIANVLMIRYAGHTLRVDSWLIASARFGVGLGVLVLFYLPGGRFQPVHLVTNPWLILRGILGGCSVFIFYLTITHMGAGRATFVNNTYVLFGLVFAYFFLRENPGVKVAWAMLPAFLGLLFLTDLINETGGLNLYDNLAVLAAIQAGGVVALIRFLHAREHTATIFGSQCLYGLLFCLIPALLRFENPSLAGWCFLLGSGLCAAIGQIAMTYSFKVITVGQGGLIQLLVPVGIAIGGVILFQETYTPFETLGAVLILGSCSVALSRRHDPAKILLPPTHPVAAPDDAPSGAARRD